MEDPGARGSEDSASNASNNNSHSSSSIKIIPDEVIDFAALSKQASVKALTEMEQKYPAQFAQAVNEAASSSEEGSFLHRMIQASQNTIFNLAQRMTPLMIAAAHDNENGVKLLLEEAKKRNILEQYVNLDCGSDNKKFKCPTRGTALHIVCQPEKRDKTSVAILKVLLEAKANIHAQDEYEHTPLRYASSLFIKWHEHPSVLDPQFHKINLLLEAGANPHVGRQGDSPADRVNQFADSANFRDLQPFYNHIKRLFEKHSKNK